MVINHSRILNLMPVFRRYFDKINIINKLKNDNVNKTKAFLVNLNKIKNEKNNIRKNLIRKRMKVILIKRKNNILRIRKIFK